MICYNIEKKTKGEKTMTKIREILMDTMIREYGFEDSNTITFSNLCEMLPDTRENDLILLKKLKEFREAPVFDE